MMKPPALSKSSEEKDSMPTKTEALYEYSDA